MSLYQPTTKLSCFVVASLTHYFTLSTAVWISCQALHLSHQPLFTDKLKSNLGILAENKMEFVKNAVKFCHFWPMSIVLINLLVVIMRSGTSYLTNELDGLEENSRNPEGYLHPLAPSENTPCWIQGPSFTWALLFPIIFLYGFSLLVFTRISYVLLKSRNSSFTQRSLETTILALLALSALLGFGWPVGFLIAISKVKFYNFTFRFLFILLTATQGIVIFYSFSCKSKEAKLGWKYLLEKFKLYPLIEGSKLDIFLFDSVTKAGSHNVVKMNSNSSNKNVTKSSKLSKDSNGSNSSQSVRKLSNATSVSFSDHIKNSKGKNWTRNLSKIFKKETPAKDPKMQELEELLDPPKTPVESVKGEF